jgi:putative DNA primase/helicase
MIEIAQARGWSEITLTGTERFRKEAWAAARIAGLEVKGYKASDFEQERLVRSLARQMDIPRERSKEAERDAHERPADKAEKQRPRAKREDPVVGRLVDHGAAPYQQQPGGPPSYFVRLETARGDRTVWGIDLERALRESLSQPRPGDEIELRRARREPVTVKTPERDNQGNVVGERSKETHRNQWIVETREFLEKRAAAAQVFSNAKISATSAVRKNPELLGSYLQLRSAEEVASARIRDAEDQRQFVALVRSTIAESIANGAPLPPVRIRERGAVRSEAHVPPPERIAPHVRG